MWVQLVYLNIIRFFSGYAHIATFNLKKQTYAGHTAVLFDTTDLHQVQNVRTGTQADKHLSNTNTASVFEHFSLYDLPVELQMQYKQKVLFSEIFHFSPVFNVQRVSDSRVKVLSRCSLLPRKADRVRMVNLKNHNICFEIQITVS